MLGELAIKNFAIIDDIHITFADGLSVLTGETGAGKSIIIEAVNLLLGGRAASDLVRTGEEQAELEAFFPIDSNSNAARIMKESDMDPQEGLMIRRIISATGRHRIYVNSRQSTIQFLKTVTRNLASISSQHAHQGLLDEEKHLDILDRFAALLPLREEIEALYKTLTPLIHKVAQLQSGKKKSDEENALLRFQLEEIETARIQPDEDRFLEKERARLKSASEIFDIVQGAVQEIYLQEGSVLERLGAIQSNLDRHATKDVALSPMVAALSRSVLDLEDLTHDLRRYGDGVDLRPEALEETEARLDMIQKLKRKYGGSGATLEALFQRHNDIKAAISGTESMGEEIEQMTKQIDQLSAEMGKKAKTLSDARKKAALILSKMAEEELKSLDMGNTRFQIAVTQTPSKDQTPPPLTKDGWMITSSGMDRVSFLMAPNPGEEPRPLHRIASGGELSRVVLALKAILTETEPVGTLVFDEVDSGIGGLTADKVGIKLKALSEKYQLLCITHLPQIARFGNHHYKIEKEVVNQRTATVITPLKTKDERIQEIARMMGGDHLSRATLKHAEELLRGAP